MPSSRDRDLDLRNARRESTGSDQRRERIDQSRRPAEPAPRHSCRSATMALKRSRNPTSERPLRVHEARTQPRATPVAPRLARQRRQAALRLHLAEPAQRLAQLRVLDRQLRSRREVLQRAAAAVAEMRALRRDAIGRRRDHADQLPLVEAALALADPVFDGLTGKRAGHEHDLARLHDAPAVVVLRVDDVALQRRRQRLRWSGPSGRRNST